jgi:hypothetical protein
LRIENVHKLSFNTAADFHIADLVSDRICKQQGLALRIGLHDEQHQVLETGHALLVLAKLEEVLSDSEHGDVLDISNII